MASALHSRVSLKCQQSTLHRQSAAETTERTIAGDDAMARDENWYRVGAASGTGGPQGLGLADLLRDPAIGPRLARRDFGQCTPNALLKSRTSGEVDGHAPPKRMPGSISVQLPGEVLNKGWKSPFCFRRSPQRAVSRKMQRGNPASRVFNSKRAELGRDDYRITNQMIHNAAKDNPSHMKKRFRICRCTCLRGL